MAARVQELVELLREHTGTYDDNRPPFEFHLTTENTEGTLSIRTHKRLDAISMAPLLDSKEEAAGGQGAPEESYRSARVLVVEGMQELHRELNSGELEWCPEFERSVAPWNRELSVAFIELLKCAAVLPGSREPVFGEHIDAANSDEDVTRYTAIIIRWVNSVVFRGILCDECGFHRLRSNGLSCGYMLP